MVSKTQALYILGGPGVGKSSVMDGLMEDWDAEPESIPLGEQFRGHKIRHREDGVEGLYLGVLRDEFGGTDALGMRAPKAAKHWALMNDHPPVILGEGARLGLDKFLVALSCKTNLTVVLLEASEDAMRERRLGRNPSTQRQWKKRTVNDAQNDTWARGANTRALRAAERSAEAGVTVVPVDAEQPLAEVIEDVRLIAP